MMTKKDAPRSEMLHMRGTIIIDLDAIRAIHEKLLEYEFSKVTYQFSIDGDEYQCDCVDEIATDAKEKRLTKIDNLEIRGCDEKERRICVSLKTDLLSQTCTIWQSHKNPLLRCLADEILKILKEQNKSLTKIGFSVLPLLERFIVPWTILNIVLLLSLKSFPDELRYCVEIYLVCVFSPVMILSIPMLLQSFKVSILVEPDAKTSFFSKYNIADKIVAAVIIALVGLIFKIFSSW